MRRIIGVGVLMALGFAALPAVAVASAATTAAEIECDSVTGSATFTPGLATAPSAQTLQLHTFNVSQCRGGTTARGAVAGSLQSDDASCPHGHHQRFHGAAEIDWHDGSVSYIKNAKLEPTNNADEPFESLLHGAISGGARTGATLEVVLDLTPTHGDCTTAVTAVSLENVTPLTIGGPYATCHALSGGVTITPGLTATAAEQTMHFDTVAVTGCHGTAQQAAIIGALSSAGASCPPAPGERFHGTLEIDWDNHFVSIARTMRLDSTGNPADPFEARLHGVIKKGADTGATISVLVHLSASQGDCSTGVTAATITNVGQFTIT